NDDRRGGFNRDDRGGERRSFNRDERPRRFEDRNDDRRGGFNRDDRGGLPRFERDDRGGERRSFNRDERPRQGSRFGDREERGFGGGRSHDGHSSRSHHRPLDAAAGHRHRQHEDHSDADQMEWSQAEVLEGGSVDTAFADLGLPASLVAALSAQGIETPFPIQAVTIPDAVAGRDVLGRAETGSGKTLGFGLPLLARLGESGHQKNPRAVILTPTRELAVQVADALSPLAAGLGLKVILVAGGMSYGPQLRAFDRGVDVVVATPGRMVDLMEQYAVDLSSVEVTVLDEADHMADLGFLPAVTQIMDSTPPGSQRLLFSATLDNAVAKLVSRYMTDPVTHEVDSGRASVSTMTHHVLHVQGHEKSAVAAHLVNRPGKTIVFVRTQLGADRVARTMQEVGVLAAPLHGGLTQGQRVRTLNAFKTGALPVIIATDVAARGIHVDDVSLVLQMDPPMGPKDYLHRAGRTARAGNEGVVVTIAQPNQRRMVQRLLENAGVAMVDPLRVKATDEVLATISGGAPAEGTALDPDKVAAILAPPKSVRRGGGSGRKTFRGGGRRRW
ncbi:MAG: DEAD/DEAH box helicase, partial [Propionibacteriaceae bacterium]